MIHVRRVATHLAWLVATALFSGCAATFSTAAPPTADPRAAAIQTVAQHACDLVRAEAPAEVETLRSTISALSVLLKDDQVDWGVISATFDEIPVRSRRYLGLSAAMAKQYADDVPAYYDGLRRLTTGCLTALVFDPLPRRAHDAGRRVPPSGQPADAGASAR
jgi:hypothetical protein